VIILEENEAWTQEMSRDVSQYILPTKNTTIHYPRKLYNNFHKHVDFLLIVSSDPSKFDRREAIRETWGRDNHYGLRLGLVFLMGLSSDPEVRKNDLFLVYGVIFTAFFHILKFKPFKTSVLDLG
jgi:hypothetical protein